MPKAQAGAVEPALLDFKRTGIKTSPIGGHWKAKFSFDLDKPGLAMFPVPR